MGLLRGETEPVPQSFTLKNDRYRRDAGGKSRLFDISCASCNTHVLVYQKDGEPGNLRKCFLNRILWPSKYDKMVNGGTINSPVQVPNLECPKCSSVLGTPFTYDDGRIAFRIFHGRVSRKPNYNTAK